MLLTRYSNASFKASYSAAAVPVVAAIMHSEGFDTPRLCTYVQRVNELGVLDESVQHIVGRAGLHELLYPNSIGVIMT